MAEISKRQFLVKNPRGSVQIIHGMREHSERYIEFAKYLEKNGYSVFLSDHPYHGKNLENFQGDKNFFETALEKQLDYSKEIKEKFPEVPLYILGHSMGSFILQRYMQVENSAEGFILSGSCGKRFLTVLGEKILSFFLKNFNDRKSSAFESLVFLGFNRKETNDWLSRDKRISESIESDPYWIKCYPLSFYRDFFNLINSVFLKENLGKIDINRPIFIFSGDMDPVGLKGKGVEKLLQQYKKIKCKDVQMKLYSGGRHEMLNEINREEVYRDIISWLNKLA